MKKNELVPVGNGESFTRCGWIRLALKTLFEDPHASFFVETIPLCVQLNLIVLLRLAIELLAVSLPTAILNIGFCLLLSYLTAPVLLELIFVSYLYQK